MQGLVLVDMGVNKNKTASAGADGHLHGHGPEKLDIILTVFHQS